jgi:hypothetical protein
LKTPLQPIGPESGAHDSYAGAKFGTWKIEPD